MTLVWKQLGIAFSRMESSFLPLNTPSFPLRNNAWWDKCQKRCQLNFVSENFFFRNTLFHSPFMHSLLNCVNAMYVYCQCRYMVQHKRAALNSAPPIRKEKDYIKWTCFSLYTLLYSTLTLISNKRRQRSVFFLFF